MCCQRKPSLTFCKSLYLFLQFLNTHTEFFVGVKTVAVLAQKLMALKKTVSI